MLVREKSRLHSRNKFSVSGYGYVFITLMLLLIIQMPALAAGTRISSVNSSKDTIPPKIYSSQDCDGSIRNGFARDYPDDSSSRSNLAVIMLRSDSTDNFTFGFKNFIPGQSRETNWTLLVQNKFKDDKAQIIFIDLAGNADTLRVTYTSPKYHIEPPIVNFNTVRIDESVFREILLINDSPIQNLTVDYLLAKNQQSGFSIDYTPSSIVEPLDTMRFTVNFHASHPGYFSDSIGVNFNACNYLFENKMIVSASVVSPLINTDDVYFNDVTIGDSSIQSVKIRNTGVVDLIIHGCSLPTYPEFKPLLPLISADNPIVIRAGDYYTFDVKFKPKTELKYIDSIVFHSNAESIDSICYLTANSVVPGLLANSYDWKRQRIDRSPQFPAGPYEADVETIVLKNTGKEIINIYRMMIVEEEKADAFIYNPSDFYNINLQPGQSKYIHVAFQPKEPGVHRLIIKYDNDINSKTETRLYGIGTVPVAEVKSIYFDTAVVQYYLNPVSKTLRIRNTDWDYADDLTINDIISAPNGDEISTNMDKWGTKGYKLDKSSIGLPLRISPGSYKDIDVFFVPREHGPSMASLSIGSDALSPLSSTFSGFGITQGIKVKGDSIAICLLSSDTLRCSVENIGSEIITIDSIRTGRQYQDLTFINSMDSLPFELDPGQKKSILFNFTPQSKDNVDTELLVFNNTQNMSRLSVPIKAKVIHIQRKLALNADSNTSMIPGDTLYVVLSLVPGEDIKSIGLNELFCEIGYSPQSLRYSGYVRLSDTLAGKFIPPSVTKNDSTGLLNFTLKGISSEIFWKSGDIITLGFVCKMPEKDESDSAVITAKLTDNTNYCVAFESPGQLVKKLDHRIDSTLKWKWKTIKENTLIARPNPAYPGEAYIDFTVYKTSFCNLLIYNEQGMLIGTAINREISEGVYTLDLSSYTLHAGVYLCLLEQGSDRFYIKFSIIN